MRSVRALWIGLGAALVAGCSAIRFEPDTPPVEPPRQEARPAVSAAGSWAGAWVVEGQRIQGSLELAQSGADLTARFSSSALGEATGSGKVGDDGQVSLELSYRTQCPGRARLTGQIMEEG